MHSRSRAETRQIYVQASLAGLTDVAPIELIEQPNPYMDDDQSPSLNGACRFFNLGQTAPLQHV